MRQVWVSDNMKKELDRIKRGLELKEQKNIPMSDTTERVAKILKKIRV